jgi:hypothetical protein
VIFACDAVEGNFVAEVAELKCGIGPPIDARKCGLGWRILFKGVAALGPGILV